MPTPIRPRPSRTVRSWRIGRETGLRCTLGRPSTQILHHAAHLASPGLPHRIDTKVECFPERGYVKIRGGGRTQLLATFVLVVAPYAGDHRRAGNLPANAPDRMAQVHRAAAEIEIGQANHVYAGTIEA